MDDSARLQAAKTLLKERLNENPSIAEDGRFACNKINFPHCDADLAIQLVKLGIPELAQFLRWIPLTHFNDIAKLGKGGFAQVYKGTVHWGPHHYALTRKSTTSDTESPEVLYATYSIERKYALKEITPNMAAEVRCSA